jgi:cytochrome c556
MEPVRMKKNAFLLVSILILACAWQPSNAHGPSGHGEHSAADDGAAMKAQHERMEKFRSAAQTLFDAIIRSDGKMAAEGAEQLQKSLAGHEKDAPHKNRQRAKEFHALYVDLGKRTEKMLASVRKNDFSKAAVSYGEVLSVCAACHKQFRD